MRYEIIEWLAFFGMIGGLAFLILTEATRQCKRLNR